MAIKRLVVPDVTPHSPTPMNTIETPEVAVPHVAAVNDAVVRVKTVYGDYSYVKQSDLDGTRTILPLYTKGGERIYTDEKSAIHRENLDPTGEKATKAWKDIHVIAGKDMNGLKTRAAVVAEIHRLGQNTDSFDIKEEEGVWYAERFQKEVGQPNIPDATPVLPVEAAATVNEPLIVQTEPPTPRGGKTRRNADDAKRRDLFQEVTDRMMQAIEEGTAPWQKPWQSRFGWPANPTTGKPYHGINVLLLSTAGYQDPRWCSYEQAKKAGWQVRGGEKAERIYFYKIMTKDTGELDPATCLPKVNTIPLFRSHSIFNLSQIDNAPALETGVQHEAILNDVTEQTILDLIEASGAQIATGRTHAAYIPKDDQIIMPAKDTFKSDAHYYAALLHELAHWSGHESRLNRAFSFDRSSADYAREELRAEMASAMISMQLGIPPGVQNHEGYVASYLKILRDDKKEIFRAAKDAETISRFILRYDPDLKDRLEVEVRDQVQAASDAGAPEEFFDASLFDDFDTATPSFKP